MATSTLTKDNFEQVVTGKDTVVVDFWAPWCGPCRAFAPTFEATSEKYPGIVFAKVNTEDEPDLAGHFEIRSIPTLMVFREKVLLFSQPGALPASALESIIKKVQELDMADVHREIAASEAAEAGNPVA
jgi:thioredoxin 1